ncbi:serine/threonine-protein phosphatase [Halopseudomonas aestusnigri]|jgi:serine/threonine-protein phosphatase Stp1|uniref:PP2C family protein-serine/threonine phosphatase n=1 Tax=Halopseudomonas TaxID=2901189 RepID=UPI000C3D7016|nr:MULTISPECIES: PP2C family serine/threonine-protein phosphatase [Halopseudomonas]MAK75144.1 protein phosphatase [Pseudomonadales bacterium]MEE2798181.1 PP2C family serine/threonine-protein phosphatase [Pseudomonadota bacterium]HBT57589.1 protein phosphatase [Pseudomonas sp.]MAP75915.1 protein phosphatase [Pseudomonadales bacterium]MAS67286.1 protein phosphatase [Pseudomonadales bacterium]|tara:strand:+ start:15968 stop:16696 length:729 start_codon:yes stop_codon:yes gene_type:complete
MNWSSCSQTDPGNQRRHNEDAILALQDYGLWAVADGMGGHRNGALASRLIIDTLGALELTGNIDQNQRRVRQALQQVNRRLTQDMTQVQGQPAGPVGSTVVILLASANRALCLWAGDSRCYLWRQQTLHQLTRDHSLLQQLIDRGAVTSTEAASHPGAHVLTRAVGAHDHLKLDSVTFMIQPGDTLLLCSDGLHRELSPAQLSSALEHQDSSGAAQLVSLALRGPARDNLSAVVVRIGAGAS